MNKNSKVVTLGVIFISLLITSCKKEECDCENSRNVSSSGYIKVNLTGESFGGLVLNDSFTADKYPASNLYQYAYYVDFGNSRSFHISRSEDINSDKSVSIEFEVSDQIISNVTIVLMYRKKLDDKSVFVLTYGDYDFNSGEITNLSFDETSNTLTGNYKVTYNYRINASITRTAVVSGDFNIHLTELMNK